MRVHGNPTCVPKNPRFVHEPGSHRSRLSLTLSDHNVVTVSIRFNLPQYVIRIRVGTNCHNFQSNINSAQSGSIRHHYNIRTQSGNNCCASSIWLNPAPEYNPDTIRLDLAQSDIIMWLGLNRAVIGIHHQSGSIRYQ